MHISESVIRQLQVFASSCLWNCLLWGSSEKTIQLLHDYLMHSTKGFPPRTVPLWVTTNWAPTVTSRDSCLSEQPDGNWGKSFQVGSGKVFFAMFIKKLSCTDSCTESTVLKPELPYWECRRLSLIQLGKGLDIFSCHYPLFSASQPDAADCQSINLAMVFAWIWYWSRQQG